MLVSIITLLLVFGPCVVANGQDTCAWLDDTGTCHDASFQTMSAELSQGNVTFWAYVHTDISTFYNETPGSRKAKKPLFSGQFGKWINLTPHPTRLFWDGGRENHVYIADIGPFQAAATATFPGHKFLLTPRNEPGTILKKWTVQPDVQVMVYDPFEEDPSEQHDFNALTSVEMEMYKLHKDNLLFAQEYRKVTGREWIALYPHQQPPTHFMWRADFFNQTHLVETEETHFVSLPPKEKLKQYSSKNSKELGSRQLAEYRSPEPTQSFTMTVLSCSPRAFEIKNFLSDVEVDHFMELATGMNLSLSTTRASEGAEARTDSATRTSHNTWVPREKSPIIDAMYRRAANVLRIDEALLRRRQSFDEVPYGPSATLGSIAETLQLVHYRPSEQYTPHHDFSVPPADSSDQTMRFATVLLYLNEGMDGGETAFPRWLNAETSDSLKVVPEKGKAVLFYSLLPDGNPDERSQHAALPVKKGEKWLTNLWVWDPYMK